ncbi:MAG TPA: hypothetical protein VGK89_11425 [Candidatus Eisenbacteria bacterium]|jgi:hypothetical protein
MDDRFMNELRRDPDPRFARELRARLRAQETQNPEPARRLGRTLAAVLAAALVVAPFAFPSVRASAQALLDLFRVRKFAAVQFDETRAEKLRQLGADKELMVFDRQETVRDPGAPEVVASVEAAAAAAGFQVSRPGYLPDGLTPDTVRVQGAGEARLSVSEAKLRSLLDALDLRDVALPSGLDGKVVEVRKPPIVIQQFHNGRLHATVVQSNSPELAVPAGLDIERLAEIGLRVLGLDPGEARRIARTTDWRSTLLVPVPINASTFRQVTVHSQQGLLITLSGRDGEGDRRREGSIVLWSEGDRVFGVLGNLADKDLLQMAESVQ